jgi:DNA-binding PadR family transcriptional regulator
MSLRHALLGLLAQGPASGYDLLKRFNSSLAFVWPAKQSQVYGELGRLAEAELIVVTDTGARNRKEYGITDAGRAELHRWLTQTQADWSYRNEAILRVFFLWTLSPTEAAAYLDRFAEQIGARRAAFERIRDEVEWGDSDAERYARITLEHGLRSTQATEEWARWAAREVAAPPTQTTRAR